MLAQHAMSAGQPGGGHARLPAAASEYRLSWLGVAPSGAHTVLPSSVVAPGASRPLIADACGALRGGVDRFLLALPVKGGFAAGGPPAFATDETKRGVAR